VSPCLQMLKRGQVPQLRISRTVGTMQSHQLVVWGVEITVVVVVVVVVAWDGNPHSHGIAVATMKYTEYYVSNCVLRSGHVPNTCGLASCFLPLPGHD
jgi:hypothetical protein